MKKIATLAIALTLTAGASLAGGYVAPVVEATPVVVEDNGSSSNAGLIVPALLLLGVIAAVASDS
jgi:hypothetical protein